MNCDNARVALDCSSDGVEYIPCLAGAPRGERLFADVSFKDNTTTILLPLAMDFGSQRYVFADPGQMFARLRIISEGKQCNGVEITGGITVQESDGSDLRFIEKVESSEFWKGAIGIDPIEWEDASSVYRQSHQEEATYRMSGVITQLLNATRASNPRDLLHQPLSDSQALGLAEALWQLTVSNQESSYAPYSAFYCATVFANEIAREFPSSASRDALFAAVKAHRNLGKAEAAFLLAARRGDDYIKPRALHFLALLKGWCGEKTQFENLMRDAVEATIGTGKLRESIEKSEWALSDWLSKVEK